MNVHLTSAGSNSDSDPIAKITAPSPTPLLRDHFLSCKSGQILQVREVEKQKFPRVASATTPEVKDVQRRVSKCQGDPEKKIAHSGAHSYPREDIGLKFYASQVK